MSRSDRNAKAAEYLRLAPNYSAEAIESLRRGAGLSNDADIEEVLSRLIPLLESGHKFVLPVNAEILGREVAPFMVGGYRLPFSELVIEYRCERTTDSIPGPDDMFVPKRIVVCQEKSVGGMPLGVAAWPIFFGNGEWNPACFGLFAPYVLHDQEVTFSFFSIGGLASRFMKRYPDQSEAEKIAVASVASELRAVFQLMAALSCSNVSTELIRPNREARAARPESTLFDYHILTIKTPVGRTEPHELGGSHASPRTHLRRGHIRQHPTAGRIWVNSCVVNPTAIGTVNKDYRIV